MTPPGTGTLVLPIIADDNSAASFWRLDTQAGIVAYGPQLLRQRLSAVRAWN